MPSLTDVTTPSLASTTAASKLAMRRFRMSPISSLRIAIARCVPDLRSGHRGLKLLKMAANAVVDDAIAHPDLKSADEGGIVDGLEADWMRQAHRQHPLDPPLGRPVEGQGGPHHDADDAGRRVDHGPVLGDHVRDEPEAPMGDEQPDQVAGGRRHPLEEPLQDRAALFQGPPWVRSSRRARSRAEMMSTRAWSLSIWASRRALDRTSSASAAASR